ncbi:hypothetical protein [Limimaricola soesokkakensis]|uniref:hypothetical protein n=1 Tax=Limimaricola soesokkakensis TaxID=1343159 RepID=UPI003518F681
MKQKLEIARAVGLRAPALSAVENEILTAFGIESREDPDLLPMLATLEKLLATSLPLLAVAEVSGFEPGELRERLEEGRLLGLWLDGHWRVLGFQLTVTGLLPGLDTVLSKFRRDLAPVDVYAFFVTPQPRLLRSGRMSDPVEWLVSGGDPEFVAELASHL